MRDRERERWGGDLGDGPGMPEIMAGGVLADLIISVTYPGNMGVLTVREKTETLTTKLQAIVLS